MPSFSGIHLALQAILANQNAMEVVTHNVSNANTEGYHRQEAVLTANPPQTTGGWISSSLSRSMGTGVMMDSVDRYAMKFTDMRYRSELANSGRWEAEAQLLATMEITLADTSVDSISNRLDEYWGTWQALANDPEDPALRQDVMSKGESLAMSFNSRAERLHNLRVDQNMAIIERVGNINEMAFQIAELNEQIGQVLSTGGKPNDLFDKRDLLLDKLSQLSGASSHEENNGHVNVSIGGHFLVIGTTPYEVSTTTNAENLVELEWADGATFQSLQGELLGLFHGRDDVVVEQMDWLDDLASTFITSVNTLHNTGVGMNNETGFDFFTGTDALSMTFNSTDMTVDRVATAELLDSPGDGNLAKQIADLQNSLLFHGGTASIKQYNNERIGSLALDVSQAQNLASDHGVVREALYTQREEVAGVNLNEEAANMVKYQMAYNAAARLMTTIDEMLDRVINGMGLVGR
ncbi:MAG: flagellar hook-associated protein FlgK [Anaerolineaceae bacterium]|nr:flagellar hook-associated protein FlgK [Anaerolineaceae bacterium]